MEWRWRRREGKGGKGNRGKGEGSHGGRRENGEEEKWKRMRWKRECERERRKDGIKDVMEEEDG